MYKDMQIIIPMTGNGSRFKEAGFKRLKPFIEVHGIPMIEWVTRMFPNCEENFTFICRAEHLDELPYVKDILTRIAPGSTILRADNWIKLGPANDVLNFSNHIDDMSQVIICYCDFFMTWDFEKFLSAVSHVECDGAIPCYTGFHPHLCKEKNVYASCLVDDADHLVEIKEKYSWTEDKTLSRHSPGLYYFKTGAIMKSALSSLIRSNETIGGEYYVSMAFNYLVEEGCKVWCPTNVEHFCQWGTPDDLNDYLFWINSVRKQRDI